MKVHCVRGTSLDHRTRCGLDYVTRHKIELTHRWPETTCRHCLRSLKQEYGWEP